MTQKYLREDNSLFGFGTGMVAGFALGTLAFFTAKTPSGAQLLSKMSSVLSQRDGYISEGDLSLKIPGAKTLLSPVSVPVEKPHEAVESTDELNDQEMTVETAKSALQRLQEKFSSLTRQSPKKTETSKPQNTQRLFHKSGHKLG